MQRTLESLQLKRIAHGETPQYGYKNPDNDPRGLWKSVTLTGNNGDRPNLYYSIRTLTERILPPPGSCWAISRGNVPESLQKKADLLG